jgi:hypothetical protein
MQKLDVTGWNVAYQVAPAKYKELLEVRYAAD